MFKNGRWIFLAFIVVVIAAMGIIFGKIRGAGFIEQMYERKNFTLLDDKGDFFELKNLPEKRFALLIFTPDAIPTNMVQPLYDFGKTKEFFQVKNIELILVTRTNSEIVKNFKRASKFPGRLLIDTSGTVGKIAGVWEDKVAIHWSYILTDNKFHIYWQEKSPQVLSLREVEQAWAKAIQ